MSEWGWGHRTWILETALMSAGRGISVYLCGAVYAHTWIGVWRSEISSALSRPLFTNMLKQGVSLDPELQVSHWTQNLLIGLACSTDALPLLPKPWGHGRASMPSDFYVGAGDLNLCPHAYMASPVPTQAPSHLARLLQASDVALVDFIVSGDIVMQAYAITVSVT